MSLILAGVIFFYCFSFLIPFFTFLFSKDELEFEKKRGIWSRKMLKYRKQFRKGFLYMSEIYERVEKHFFKIPSVLFIFFIVSRFVSFEIFFDFLFELFPKDLKNYFINLAITENDITKVLMMLFYFVSFLIGCAIVLYLFGSICDFLARNTNRAFNSEFSAFDLRISIKALIGFILNIALIVELLAMNLFYICDLLGQTHDFLGRIKNDSSYYDFFKLLPTLSCLAIGFTLSLGLIVRKVKNNEIMINSLTKANIK